MAVCDVSVVDDSDIRCPTSPERLGGTEVHDRLGTKTGMANAVGTGKSRDMVLALKQSWTSHFLGKLHRVTDAEYPDAFTERLDPAGQRGQIDISSQQKTDIDAAR